MKSSIGNDLPADAIDADKDGAADLAEREFAHDGETSPGTRPLQPRPFQPRKRDDDGLESARQSGDAVVPPRSN
jgi:hypothetical protein